MVSSQIVVKAKADYLPEQSDPNRSEYLFTYRVRIENHGEEPAKLVRRQWVIRDGAGHVSVVKGNGVVGETPVIRPGEAFEYSSFCPLPTPTGVMEGTYELLRDSGEWFEAKIPPIDLIRPGTAFH